MNTTERLRGDYATMCLNRADALRQRLDYQLQFYSGGTGSAPRGAVALAAAHQHQAEAEETRAKMESWIARGKTAATKGLFLIREEDFMDAEFMMDKVAQEHRRAAQAAGLVTNHA
jgi:hypothetical protein